MKATLEDLQSLDRKAIADKYQVSEKTVIRWLKAHSLYQPIRNCGRKLDDEQAKQIREAHKLGSSRQDLAILYEVTEATIGRIVNEVTHCPGEPTAIVSMIYNIE